MVNFYSLLGCDLVDVVQSRPVHYAIIQKSEWLYKYLDVIILSCLFVKILEISIAQI